MPDIQANLEFLADIPLYETEKPYLALVPPRPGFDPNTERMDNLEWETHSGIAITDIRGQSDTLTIDKCGFQVMQHSTRVTEFDRAEELRAYREETEALLRDTLQASYVLCYDLKVSIRLAPRSFVEYGIAPKERCLSKGSDRSQ